MLTVLWNLVFMQFNVWKLQWILQIDTTEIVRIERTGKTSFDAPTSNLERDDFIFLSINRSIQINYENWVKSFSQK